VKGHALTFIKTNLISSVCFHCNEIISPQKFVILRFYHTVSVVHSLHKVYKVSLNSGGHIRLLSTCYNFETTKWVSLKFGSENCRENLVFICISPI
jgi:hypothetical protein